MSDLHIERKHNLSQERITEVMDNWLVSAENDYGMQCEKQQEDSSYTITFKRKGVTGEVVADADKFVMTAQLGFLFRSFLPKIEEQINNNLDELLK